MLVVEHGYSSSLGAAVSTIGLFQLEIAGVRGTAGTGR